MAFDFEVEPGVLHPENVIGAVLYGDGEHGEVLVPDAEGVAPVLILVVFREVAAEGHLAADGVGDVFLLECEELRVVVHARRTEGRHRDLHGRLGLALVCTVCEDVLGEERDEAGRVAQPANTATRTEATGRHRTEFHFIEEGLLSGSWGQFLDDPGAWATRSTVRTRAPEKRRAVLVSDPGVDGGRTNRLMTEVVLDEFQGHTGVEKMGRNRVAKRMRGGRARNAGQIAVSVEERLDLAFPEGAAVSGEQRTLWSGAVEGLDMTRKQLPRPGEERTLGPRAAFESLHEDPGAREIDVRAGEQSHLRDAEAVQVDEGEEGAVARTEPIRKNDRTSSWVR